MVVDDDFFSGGLLKPTTTMDYGTTLRATDHKQLDPWSGQYEQRTPLFRGSVEPSARLTGGLKSPDAGEKPSPPSLPSMSINGSDVDVIVIDP